MNRVTPPKPTNAWIAVLAGGVFAALRRFAKELRRSSAAALGHTFRAAIVHRRGLIGAMTRVGWWGSLLLLLWGAQRLLDAPRFGHLEEPEFDAFLGLALGWALSAATCLLAPQRHVRYCAFALAASHGSLGLLAWWAMHP